MSGFVADASATLPWRFEDEATPWTEPLLDRIQYGEEVRVPAHWPLEVANALLIGRRRGRVTARRDRRVHRRPGRPSHSPRTARWSGAMAHHSCVSRAASPDGLRCGLSGTGPTHGAAARYARSRSAKSGTSGGRDACGGNMSTRRTSMGESFVPVANVQPSLRIPVGRSLLQTVTLHPGVELSPREP
jgi:hypothetical protein